MKKCWTDVRRMERGHFSDIYKGVPKLQTTHAADKDVIALQVTYKLIQLYRRWQLRKAAKTAFESLYSEAGFRKRIDNIFKR